MNNDTIQGDWEKIKGKIKKQWGKFSNEDLDEVKGSYSELKGKLRTLYGYAKDQAEEEIKSFFANENIQLAKSQVEEIVSMALEKIKATSNEAQDNMITYIKKYPLKSVGVALVVGLVTGRFLS